MENVVCTSKEELLSREKHHIVSNICVNKHIPTRSREEYRQDKKEAMTKEYRQRKYICESCEVEIPIGKRQRHERTKKHQQNTVSRLSKLASTTEK